MLFPPLRRVCSIVLQLPTPNLVLYLRSLISISFQETQVLRECQSRMRCNLRDAQGCLWWRKRGRYDDSGDVVHRDLIHGIVYTGTAVKLNTAFDHADQEIISVGDAGGFV